MADRGPKWAPAARSGRYARRRRWPEGSAATASKNIIRAGVRPGARATEESRPGRRIRAKAAGESLRHAVLTRRRPAQQAKQIRKAGGAGGTEGPARWAARRTAPMRGERQRPTAGTRVGKAAVRQAAAEQISAKRSPAAETGTMLPGHSEE